MRGLKGGLLLRLEAGVLRRLLGSKLLLRLLLLDWVSSHLRLQTRLDAIILCLLVSKARLLCLHQPTRGLAKASLLRL